MRGCITSCLLLFACGNAGAKTQTTAVSWPTPADKVILYSDRSGLLLLLYRRKILEEIRFEDRLLFSQEDVGIIPLTIPSSRRQTRQVSNVTVEAMFSAARAGMHCGSSWKTTSILPSGTGLSRQLSYSKRRTCFRITIMGRDRKLHYLFQTLQDHHPSYIDVTHSR